MARIPKINFGGTRLRYTQQPAPLIGYLPPVKVNPAAGFGTRDDVSLEQAVPGRIIGRSRIQTPIAIRSGIPGQHVAANPGSEYTQQYIKQLSFSLATTFTDVPYYIAGTIIWYLNSTNVTDLFKIRIASINADQLTWQPGNGIEGIPFSLVYITVPNAIAGATANLVYFTDTPDKPVRFF